MKRIFFLLIALPFFAFSQQNKNSKTGNDFEISGTVTGYENGTPVAFLDDETGQPVQLTTIRNGKFIIRGAVDHPTFKALVFNNEEPVVPIFVENSKMVISGDKNSIKQLALTGSEAHKQYEEYVELTKSHSGVFAKELPQAPEAMDAFKKMCENFVHKHPESYVSPVALIQLMQVSNDLVLSEKLYKSLSKDVRKGNFGQYVNQLISLAKVNAIGSVVPDFSQEDTDGKLVSISSFRGKYVLIDFWASWCRPCRDENPNVVAAFNQYHDKNFTILGVSFDQAKQSWLNAIEMDGLNWTQVSDLKGWGNAAAAIFHISSIPQNILIDPDGKIIAKNLRGEALSRKLGEVLN